MWWIDKSSVNFHEYWMNGNEMEAVVTSLAIPISSGGNYVQNDTSRSQYPPQTPSTFLKAFDNMALEHLRAEAPSRTRFLNFRFPMQGRLRLSLGRGILKNILLLDIEQLIVVNFVMFKVTLLLMSLHPRMLKIRSISYCASVRMGWKKSE